uniref:Zinc finger protein 526 n=1 Tax=Cynoglossus semilaevis TaxID=244447 RepID=A0A3P8WVG4_CYNSE
CGEDYYKSACVEHQYMCSECQQLFNTLEDVLVHQRIHTGQDADGEVEIVEGVTVQGVLDEGQTQTYQCLECGALIINPEELLQHQEMHMRETQGSAGVQYQCLDCLALFDSPDTWLEHRRMHNRSSTHSNTESLQHSKMSQGAAAKLGVLENGVQRLELRLAPGVKELQQPTEVVVIHPYECSECSLLFQTPEDFLQHQGEHFLCQDKESGESGLMSGFDERGREEALGKGEDIRGADNSGAVWAKSQKCDLCSRTFNSVNRLAAHKRVHEQGTHECPECGKVFKKVTSLQTHQRTHSGVARYLCVDCGNGYTTEMTLIMHRKSHTSDPLHKCQFCNKTFTNMTKYLYHRRTHLNRDATGTPKQSEEENMEVSSPPEEKTQAPPPGQASAGNHTSAPTTDCTAGAPAPPSEGGAISCQKCNKSFSSQLQLVQHGLTAHVAERSFVCGICGKSFKKQLHVRNHIRTHTGERPFQCSDCGKTFSFLANLMRHNLIHSGVRPYRCDVCHRTFSQSSNLRQHSLLHSKAATLRCPDCPSTFRWPTKLAAHRYTQHPGSPAPFTCPHCAAGFLSRRQRDAHCLEQHLSLVQAAGDATASVWGGLGCNICGKKLNSAANLRLHKLSHFAAGPGRPRPTMVKRAQKCPVCGKQFVSSSGVALHQRVHTGERPFPCQVCGKRFRQNTHLREHLRTHSGERPFRCEVCGKGFIQSMHLAEHRRTHTGERPHVCPLCGKAFKTFSNLRNHKKTHVRQQKLDQEAAAGTPTIMCNEFGETIAIIETSEGGELPLEQALQIYHTALENGLAVDTVAVDGLQLL